MYRAVRQPPGHSQGELYLCACVSVYRKNVLQDQTLDVDYSKNKSHI